MDGALALCSVFRLVAMAEDGGGGEQRSAILPSVRPMTERWLIRPIIELSSSLSSIVGRGETRSGANRHVLEPRAVQEDKMPRHPKLQTHHLHFLAQSRRPC